MIHQRIRDDLILNLLGDLLTIPSPSGREERMAEAICNRLTQWGYEPQIDPAGNVMVRVPASKTDAPLVCVAAHMDEIGLVVTAIEDNGDLRVSKSGGMLPFKLGERPVVILGDSRDVTGIFSFGSTHRPGAESMGQDWDEARVVTGMTPTQLARAGVRPGSPGVPTAQGRGPYVLGEDADPLVAAWTFDDRAGVVALMETLRVLREADARLPVSLLAAFTVHEEGGCHGAKVLAQREHPDVFVAVDGCPVLPDVPLALDGRPGVWSKDEDTHYDQRLVRSLCRMAADIGIGAQPVVYARAASDAGKVYACGAAPRAVTFGHVRRNSHGFEVARRSVFGNVARLLTAFVTTWSP